MDKKQEKIELRKLELEKAKVIEGQIRTLILVILGLGGGIGTLIVSFDKYSNPDLILAIIGLGTFIEAFILYISVKLWFELEEIKKRW